MMADNSRRSRQMIWLGVCMAGVLAFLLFFVYPNAVAMKDLDAQADALAQKVQEQELLHPIFASLVRQAQERAPGQLPLVVAGRLTRADIADIDTVFRTIGREAGVTFESAAPDPVSYLEETAQLILNAAFSGDFFNFRDLIFRISQLPYLGGIEQLEIRTDGDKKRIQLKLRLNQV